MTNYPARTSQTSNIEVSPKKQIPENMDILEKETIHLHDTITHLEERLLSILQPPSPQKDTAPAEISLSLSEKLSKQIDFTVGACNRLHDIMSRLEL